MGPPACFGYNAVWLHYAIVALCGVVVAQYFVGFGFQTYLRKVVAHEPLHFRSPSGRMSTDLQLGLSSAVQQGQLELLRHFAAHLPSSFFLTKPLWAHMDVLPYYLKMMHLNRHCLMKSHYAHQFLHCHGRTEGVCPDFHFQRLSLEH